MGPAHTAACLPRRNTTVQPLAEMVKEAWFEEAIRDRPDFLSVLISLAVLPHALERLTTTI